MGLFLDDYRLSCGWTAYSLCTLTALPYTQEHIKRGDKTEGRFKAFTQYALAALYALPVVAALTLLIVRIADFVCHIFSSAQSSTKAYQPIVINSNGAVDDFVTTAIIAAAQAKSEKGANPFEIPAIILTNANCEPSSALSAHLKMQKILKLNTRIALSDSRVWTPLPWMWRFDSDKIDALSFLNQTAITVAKNNSADGNTALEAILQKSEGIRLLVLGPLSTVADILKKNPELANKIAELHWMGGAIDVPGNITGSPEIPPSLLHEHAEWNAFCDPTGTAFVFETISCPIYLYPLDVSQETFPTAFLDVLAKKPQTPYSQFVDECYRLVTSCETYRMWGIVAAAGILCPEIFAPPLKEKLTILTEQERAGSIVRNENGREVFVYKKFRENGPSEFYEQVGNILTLS